MEATARASAEKAWALLLSAAERHPWLVLRAMSRLLRQGRFSALDGSNAVLLLRLAFEPVAAADVMHGSLAELPARLRSAAPAFAEAVRAWRQRNTETKEGTT